MRSEISKKIGWDYPQIVGYPTMEMVESAGELTIAQWMRFLRSPQTEREIVILNRIITRDKEFSNA